MLARFSHGESKSEKPIEVVFYNVENLFDTVDDTTVWDDHFLPDSLKEWTVERCEKSYLI